MRALGTGRGRSTRPLPLVALALGAALCAPGVAAAGPLSQTLDNLAARQDPIGGGYGPTGGSDSVYTAWVALAVASAGEDTGAWRRGRASLREALLAPAPATGAGETARLAVAMVAVGADPRAAGDRDLVRRLLRAQHPDGTIGGDVSSTAWGVMALTAAGFSPTSRAVTDARRAVERAQRPDGGWSIIDDVASAPNTTADAIQALVAAGRIVETSPSLRRGRAFLLGAQRPDGGFPSVVGGDSAALTTAWVALAVRAMGDRASRPPWDRSGGPLALLTRLQGVDGSVRNSAGSREPSVWATGQAALAFAGKPLPLRPAVAASPPERSPRVVARRPLGGGRVTGPLTARFADNEGGTGVDPRMVRLRIEGRDVTARAVVREGEISLPASSVPPGPARVRLALSDRAGNAATARWRVVGPDR